MLNWSGLLSAVAELTGGGRPARPAVLGLNGLKVINDRHRHAAGNQTPRATVASLQDAGRELLVAGSAATSAPCSRRPSTSSCELQAASPDRDSAGSPITVLPGVSFTVSALLPR